MNFRKKLIQLNTTLISTIALTTSKCFAGGIGTAEVQTATDNIKRVITSIAMPLGRSSNFCKYSYCSTKDDNKCKQSTKKV